MRLVELQQAFWQAVRTRGEPPAGLSEVFTSSSRQCAADRVAVYHHAYWRRQLLVLGSTFPRLRQLLGAERFERLSLRYLERRPSSDACIERVGAQLVAFLVEQGATSPVELDVARLEWAALEALLAPDQASLGALPARIAASLADCRVELHRSVRLERVARSALELILGDAIRGRAQDPNWVVLYRRGFAVKHALLECDEAAALQAAQRGDTFGTVCEAFSSMPNDAAVARAASVLSGWLARGWLADLAPEGPR